MSSRRSGFSSTPGSTGLIVAGAGGVAHSVAGIQFDTIGSVYCGDATSDVAPNDMYMAPAGAFATATGANRTPGTFHFLVGAPTNGGTTEGQFSWERNFVQFCKLQPTSGGGAVYFYTVSVAIQSNSGTLQDGSGNTIFGWGTEPTSAIGTANYASDANLTCPAAAYRNQIIKITGTQTARNLTMPLTTGAKHFFNNTTASTVTVVPTSGTGFTIAAARGAWGYCDGTNYVRMTADSVVT